MVKLRNILGVDLFAKKDTTYRKAKDAIFTDAKELEVG